MPALPVRRTLDHRHALVPVPRLEADRRHAGRARLQPGVGLAARDDRGDARRRREGDLRHRQPDRRRARGSRRRASRGGAPAPSRAAADGIRSEIAAIERATRATERTFAAGIEALARSRDADSFFVAVDPFDPRGRRSRPRRSTSGRAWSSTDGIGPMSERLVELEVQRRRHEAAALRVHATTWRRWTTGSAGCSTPCPTTRSCSCSATSASRSATTPSSGGARPTSYRRVLRDPVPDPPPGRRRRAATASTGTPPPTTCPPRSWPTSASRSRARCAART